MARLGLHLVSYTFFLAVNGLYSSIDDIIELSPSNFDREVIPNVVKVAAVAADKHQSLGGQRGVQGFPTIKIFGSNKNRSEDYQGGRTGEAIVDAAHSPLPQLMKDHLGEKSGGYGSGKQDRSDSKKDVIEVTEDS
ncbi:Protein disulfide-isomerase A6 [Sciurus carolinensis]|uniref:Protein disulfide-isomerase A6 n=1 Tax=Sciurus carolinensis TaxID=30640 RepID=A0AA41NCS0_SCICA|nr:Protein disulfide-isomerase A6 [Sciurus carolinensis]